MRRLICIVRNIILSAFAVAAWPAMAFAQRGGAGNQQGPQPHGDAIPYMIVLFCLVLALIVLCRSSARTTEMLLDEVDKE